MSAPRARIASTWRSTGRRPIRSPPGLLMMTRPNRARSGPRSMKLARILAAASSGTNSHSTSPEATSYVFAWGWSTTTPRSRSVSAMTRTSSISGTFVNRQRSPVRVAAASIFRAAFFAPLIGTVPFSGRPPSMRKISLGTGSGLNSQWKGRASAMIQARRRGPSLWRRWATRSRSSACWSAARAAERSAPSWNPVSSARSASRRASAARSTSISEAMSAVSAITTTLSGRTWRKPPAIANDSSAPPLRIRSSPRPSIETRGAWCGSTPSSPSMPGRVTASTVSEYASRSGVTISSRRGTSGCQLLGVRADVVDRARQEEGLLRQRVGLALEDLLERCDRVLDRHVLPGPPGEDLGHRERLAHEPLQAASPGDRRLVLLGELVDPEDRDDLLEVLEALQDALCLAGDVVVLLADDVRVEDARRRRERVDRGVDAELGDRALEADRRVEVGERRGGCRVRVVVRRNEDGLQRRDRAVLRRGDPLLERGHLGREVRLITDGRRHPTQQGRHLRARLREAEDVVDEEQHIAVLLVSEVFGHRQPGQPDALAGARWLVHLAEHERGALDDARLGHLRDQVVALAGALAHAGEDRHAGMLLGNVPDQFLDDDRLADAGTAEDADLAALLERADQVDDLEARLEDLDLGRLLVEGGCRAVDRQGVGAVDVALAVDRVAEDVEDTAEGHLAHRNGDRSARVDDGHIASEPVCRRHRHGSDPVVAEVLLDLAHERSLAVALDLDRVVDGRQLAGRTLDVDDRTRDLDHAAVLSGCGGCHGWSSASCIRCLRLARLGAGRDLDHVAGDVRLANLVVRERVVLDQVFGVVRRIPHRDHPARLLARLALEYGLEQPRCDVAREELLEDGRGVRFEDELVAGDAFDVLGGFDGKQAIQGGALGERRDELAVDDIDSGVFPAQVVLGDEPS